jgi:type I restriction enzyme R subunit
MTELFSLNTESEWLTRKKRIDERLKSLNPKWKIIKYKQGLDLTKLNKHAVEEYPTDNGPADYALFVKGRLLGILEAKKVSVDPQNVLEQAKRYARGINNYIGNWRDYGVPFLYASNGEIIWHLDVRDEKNLSREISNFHTAPAIEELFNRDLINDEAFDNLKIKNEKLRYYQVEAIEAIESGIVDRKREMLVAMATGTGKTFTLVSSIYRLLETKLFKRILFLVDRRALAAQAVREFASFTTPQGNKFDQEYELYSQRFKKEDFGEDDPFDPKLLPNGYLTSPDATKTFVYVSTIQRMTVNLFGWERAYEQDASDPDYEEDAEQFKISIPIHAFDLIIADECHRGYTSKETAIWRSTLNYFDAIKIGLTATPAIHTTSYFGKPIFRYSTELAILDGYLVDYDAVKITSNVLMKGAFLKEGEQVGIVDTETGQETYDELEDEREFKAEEIESKITAPETNRKIIEELARYAYSHENETGRFPKILIFAVNDIQHTSHADQVVKICKEVFNQGDDFVKKITGNPNVDRPLQKIREFRNRPNPKVVVTVDMLSTGVDIPALEFVVFMRPVKSRILWVQMLGRGTRLCPEIKKDKFTIFDCFGGSLIEYFKNTTDFKVEAPEQEPLNIQQIIENIYQNVDREYYTNVLVKRLRRIEKNMSAEARGLFENNGIPDGDIGKFAKNLLTLIKNDFNQTMKLLRDENLQDLLINYPRAKRQFWIGYEVQDKVSSKKLILGEKPEDYLTSFMRFVKENPEHIAAIKILLERPKEWNTNALTELREKLKANKFPEKYLQEAHELVYDKALADIISMVKHAAKNEEPILTSEERVNLALAKITENKKFNYEQLQWLNYIKEHLVQNLTIDEDDFKHAPIFEARGGIGKARKVFGKEELSKLIEEINYNMAA